MSDYDILIHKVMDELYFNVENFFESSRIVNHERDFKEWRKLINESKEAMK